MAGIKNIYQQYGLSPYQPIQGENILDRHQNFQNREYTPYCKLCGNEIIDSNQNEIGKQADPEWERLNQVHQKCYRQYVNTNR